MMVSLYGVSLCGVTASLSSNCSLVPSEIFENLNCHVEKDSIDEEIEIDIGIFCNEEEFNASNIDDAFTNQCLAFIAGYCVVKIESL